MHYSAAISIVLKKDIIVNPKVSWRKSEKTLVQVGSLIVIFIFIPDLGQLLMDL